MDRWIDRWMDVWMHTRRQQWTLLWHGNMFHVPTLVTYLEANTSSPQPIIKCHRFTFCQRWYFWTSLMESRKFLAFNPEALRRIWINAQLLSFHRRHPCQLRAVVGWVHRHCIRRFPNELHPGKSGPWCSDNEEFGQHLTICILLCYSGDNLQPVCAATVSLMQSVT